MNLLFDLLRSISEKERPALGNLKLRGTMNEVWLLVNKQVAKGSFDREEIQDTLSISPSHLDKITSELLVKCYHALFGDDRLALLDFLTGRMGLVKHFYSELNRQVKQVDKQMPVEERKLFYEKCMTLSQINLPIALRDEQAWKKIATKYVALFKEPEKKNIKKLIECKWLELQIDKPFAASKIKDQKAKFLKKIDALGKLPADANGELIFSFYWAQLYFWHAIEEFAISLGIIEEALKVLKGYKDKGNEMNKLRLQLKQSEMQYYLSMFDETYSNLERATSSPFFEEIPDRGYYGTKFIQLSLITGKYEGATKILETRRKFYGDNLYKALAPREIFSFIKYSLFTEKYDDAFKFIQLGFEKNPKGKYFQYEIELRNLQTAYFFLTRQTEQAIEACDRHIKYLRFHGYGLRESDYPHFYALTKAIFEKKSGGKDLNEKEKEMLQRYQRGSYAVYGRLLMKMLNQ